MTHTEGDRPWEELERLVERSDPDNVEAFLDTLPPGEATRAVSRIEEECRAFLEEHAARQWLQRVQRDCQQSLQRWEGRDRRVRVAAGRFPALRQHLSQASELRSQIATCEARIAELRAPHRDSRRPLGLGPCTSGVV